MSDLTELRDAEAQAFDDAIHATTADPLTDEAVLRWDAYREAVERRVRAEVADRMGALYANTALREGARAAHAEIEAGVEPTPRSELKRTPPPEGAAS